jgi:hypothetical protein
VRQHQINKLLPLQFRPFPIDPHTQENATSCSRAVQQAARLCWREYWNQRWRLHVSVSPSGLNHDIRTGTRFAVPVSHTYHGVPWMNADDVGRVVAFPRPAARRQSRVDDRCRTTSAGTVSADPPPPPRILHQRRTSYRGPALSLPRVLSGLCLRSAASAEHSLRRGSPLVTPPLRGLPLDYFTNDDSDKTTNILLKLDITKYDST